MARPSRRARAAPNLPEVITTTRTHDDTPKSLGRRFVVDNDIPTAFEHYTTAAAALRPNYIVRDDILATYFSHILTETGCGSSIASNGEATNISGDIAGRDDAAVTEHSSDAEGVYAPWDGRTATKGSQLVRASRFFEHVAANVATAPQREDSTARSSYLCSSSSSYAEKDKISLPDCDHAP